MRITWGHQSGSHAATEIALTNRPTDEGEDHDEPVDGEGEEGEESEAED